MRENLVTVPPEAGAGSGKTTHQTSEDSRGVEGLPEATRKVVKDELQGHNHFNPNPIFLILILIIVIITTLLAHHKATKCQVNAVQAPLEMRVASRLSYEKYTFLTEGGAVIPYYCNQHEIQLGLQNRKDDTTSRVLRDS